MTARIFTLVVFFSTTAFASFFFQPFSGSPPKADDIGEIMFKRSDMVHKGNRYIEIERESFLEFFEKGSFSTDFKTLEEIRKMPPERNEEGGENLCIGHFATKEGRVFAFIRYNAKALEISDSNYRIGWFILP
jgi:hypothetical protein